MTPAHLQAFATFRELRWGCEHFGPQILTGEYVAEPLRFEDFHVHLPQGPGIGVARDEVLELTARKATVRAPASARGVLLLQAKKRSGR